MTRGVVGVLAVAAALVAFGARTIAQPTQAAATRPTPSPSPTPQPRTVYARPTLAMIGARVTFGYAPLAPRANAVTIGYGDGSTGTLARAYAATTVSSSATGTHVYTRASGPGGFRACVPPSTATSYAVAVVAPVCVTVIVLAPTPTPSSSATSATAVPSASPPVPRFVPTPTATPSAVASGLASPTPAASASPAFTARPTLAPSPVAPPPPIATTSPTPMPTPPSTLAPAPAPSAARTAAPIVVAPTPIAATSAAGPLAPITAWTLSWANGLYAVEIPSGNAIPPAIAQITVGSAKRVIGQWIVDGLPAATQTRTQLLPGDVATFEYDFPARPATARDRAVHRIAFVLLDPIASAPAGAPTPAPSIAYRYSIAPGSGTPTLESAGPDPGAIAALQFDGFAVSVAHLALDPAGTYSGDGSAHLADLTFPVAFSGLILGNAHATALGVTSDVTGGTATTTVATGCLRAPAATGAADPTFANQLGVFHRFSYAFSLMSATLQPLGAKSTATLCYAPADVQLGDAARNGFNRGTQADGAFGDATGRALALGLANAPIDESGAFAFDLPGDGVPSWRVGNSTFATIPTASVPYHFAFASDATTPHLSCDGTPATGALLQQLSGGRVRATVSHCAWSPTGVDATVTLAPGTALTTSDPYRFELLIDAGELELANSLFTGGHLSGTFFADRAAPGSAASGPPAASAFNANERARSVAAFVPDDVGAPASASDPTGTFDGTLSASGDLIADAKPQAWSAASIGITSARASLFVAGGQTPHPTKFENAGKPWPEIVRSLTIGATPLGTSAFAVPGLFVGAGSLERTPTRVTTFDASAPGANFGLVFVDGNGSAVVTSASETVPRNAVAIVGPKPTVTVVPGTTTLEVRWPAVPGYRGYALVRRDPAGNVVTLDPLVRAFAYRDELATGAHGDFAYALRVVTVHGLGPTGPFTSATLAR